MTEISVASVQGQGGWTFGVQVAEANGQTRHSVTLTQQAFRQLTDGKATVAVRHKGTAPDLFGEGRGAVVEGSWTPEGYFKATLIMAKHSEEYKAPHDQSAAGYHELIKTLKAQQ